MYSQKWRLPAAVLAAHLAELRDPVTREQAVPAELVHGAQEVLAGVLAVRDLRSSLRAARLPL